MWPSPPAWSCCRESLRPERREVEERVWWSRIGAAPMGPSRIPVGGRGGGQSGEGRNPKRGEGTLTRLPRGPAAARPPGFPEVSLCWRVPAPDGWAPLGHLTCLGFN